MSILGNPFTALTETIDTLSGDTVMLDHGMSLASVDAMYRSESVKRDRNKQYGRYADRKGRQVPYGLQVTRDRLEEVDAKRMALSIKRWTPDTMSISHRTNQRNAALNRKQRNNKSIRNWEQW